MYGNLRAGNAGIGFQNSTALNFEQAARIHNYERAMRNAAVERSRANGIQRFPGMEPEETECTLREILGRKIVGWFFVFLIIIILAIGYCFLIFAPKN